MDKVRIEPITEAGARRLVCAVLLHAVADALFGMPANRREARAWLPGDDARWYASMIGFGDIWPPTSQMMIDFRWAQIDKLSQSRSREKRKRAAHLRTIAEAEAIGGLA